MDLSRNRSHILFLILTVITGVALLFPFHDFQLHIAQGDHGRDLYCFRAVMDGQLPYRDFWWIYGPLMPYYYAACFFLTGVNIHSVLIGYLAVFFLAGVGIFWALSALVSPVIAFTGAAWFWVFTSPFEHTYNHVGGILASVMIIGAVFHYVKTREFRYLLLGQISIFFLALIKLNFGISSLLAFLLSVAVINRTYGVQWGVRQRRGFFWGNGIVLGATAAVYTALLAGLPFYIVRQCFPYLSEDHPFHATFPEALRNYGQSFVHLLNTHWAHYVALAIMSLAVLTIAFDWRKRKWTAFLKEQFLMTMAAIAIFCLFNWHEFLASGVAYRSFWIQPFQILAVFILIGTALRDRPKAAVCAVCLVLFASACIRHGIRVEFARFFKRPLQRLSMERGGVYTTNSPEWLSTVRYSTEYLEKLMKKDEAFLALVDDALYYFLAGQNSPTRQLAICNHLNIREEQEQEIIRGLQDKNVRYILLSNRYNSTDPSMGVFGQTYCPLLYRYILEHYHVVFFMGEWQKPPKWFENHGVKIFKRNDPAASARASGQDR